MSLEDLCVSCQTSPVLCDSCQRMLERTQAFVDACKKPAQPRAFDQNAARRRLDEIRRLTQRGRR